MFCALGIIKLVTEAGDIPLLKSRPELERTALPSFSGRARDG
jgi:hypothetical protein